MPVTPKQPSSNQEPASRRSGDLIGPTKPGSRGRSNLLALSSLAVIAVYSAGYMRTQAAARRFQNDEGRKTRMAPQTVSLPAPEPYSACPGVIEVANPTYIPLAKTAAFDAVHTEFMRRRAPPGHQCCYSWCARLEARSVLDVPPYGRCNEPLAFPEKHCIPEPEGRISKERADPPFDRCPAALRPPKAAVFSVPAAAAFHPALTNERRAQSDQPMQSAARKNVRRTSACLSDRVKPRSETAWS